MKFLKYFPVLGIFIFSILAIASVTVLSENFNSLSNGDLNGQNSWISSNTDMDVQSTSCHEGSHCVGGTVADGGYAYKDIGINLEAIPAVYILSAYLNQGTIGNVSIGVGTTTSISTASGLIQTAPTSRAVCAIGVGSSSNVMYVSVNDGSGNQDGSAVSASNYHFYELEIDSTNHTCRGRVDNGSWSSLRTYSSLHGSLRYLYIAYGFGSGPVKRIDDVLIENDQPIPVDLSGNYFTNFNPYNGSTTISTNVSVYFDFYNTGYAYPYFNKVCTEFYNLESSPLSTTFQKTICFDLVATGFNHFATTTSLPAGLTNVILYQWDEDTDSKPLATSTDFIVQYSQLAIFNGLPLYDATTTSQLVDCTGYSWITESTKRLGCEITNGFTQTIRFLFYPQTTVLDGFLAIKNQYGNKPPFGYITSIIDVFENATTTGSGSINIRYIGSFGSELFSSLRTGLAVILYIMLGVYFYKRFSNFQF